MSRKSRSLDFLFAMLLLLALLLLLAVRAPYRLEFKEQIGIFMLGADRMEWYLSNPAVISSIAGDWLTQFYSNGRVGAVLSFLLFIAILAGLAEFFRRAEPRRPLCLILLMLPVLLEYYFIPFPNYPVSATVGLVLSIWTACALARIKDSEYSCLIYGLSIPVMFVLAGGHALTLALLLGFMQRKKGAVPVISLVAGLALMMICGRFYNLTFMQTLIWPVCPGYIIPATALLILQPFLVLLTVAVSLTYYRFMENRWKAVMLSTFSALLIPLSDTVSDRNLESVVKIGTLAYHNEWDEVKRMASSTRYKDRNMYSDYYWNLCNARQGKLAEGLLQGGWGRSSDILFLSTGQGDPYFSMIYYTDALLEMGNVSDATDCALLAQTVMPGHYSTRMLRRLAEIAVVTADYDVARKYLNILMRTRNHRKWAAELLDCIEADNIPEQYLKWRAGTLDNDRFYAQGDIKGALSIIASESPYNKTAIDYLLCSYLLDKNINSFRNLYDRYYLDGLDRMVTVPELYEQALLTSVDSRESLMETIGKYHISQKTVDSYMNLLEARAKSANPQTSITTEAMGTYWHYIMAVRFNTSEDRR